MVMAPATYGGLAEWVLVRPLRPPHTGDTDPPFTTPSVKELPRPPMIDRRSSASSSFVLAAARLRALQQDPSHTTARLGQLRGRPGRTVSPGTTAAIGPDA